MIKNNGGSAFPKTGSFNSFGGENGGSAGMTLRDYFAAHALTGLLACPDKLEDELGKGAKLAGNAAKAAYMLADAMLAERSK